MSHFRSKSYPVDVLEDVLSRIKRLRKFRACDLNGDVTTFTRTLPAAVPFDADVSIEGKHDPLGIETLLKTYRESSFSIRIALSSSGRRFDPELDEDIHLRVDVSRPLRRRYVLLRIGKLALAASDETLRLGLIGHLFDSIGCIESWRDGSVIESPTVRRYDGVANAATVPDCSFAVFQNLATRTIQILFREDVSHLAAEAGLSMVDFIGRERIIELRSVHFAPKGSYSQTVEEIKRLNFTNSKWSLSFLIKQLHVDVESMIRSPSVVLLPVGNARVGSVEASFQVSGGDAEFAIECWANCKSQKVVDEVRTALLELFEVADEEW